MWLKSYSKIFPGLKKEAVWQIWADVNNWPTWDKELEYCDMRGDFKVGNQFVLKPLGGPPVKIILSDVIDNERFTDYCKFPGAKMYDTHILEETQEGLRITNTIKVTGILSFIWVKLVAKNIAEGIPRQMEALVKLASAQ